MTGTITARNSTQIPGRVKKVFKRITNQVNNAYVVPVNKLARITGLSGYIDGVGSSARVGVGIRRVNGDIEFVTNQGVIGDTVTTTEFTMIEGEGITTKGSTESTTNAGIDISLGVEEFGI